MSSLQEVLESFHDTEFWYAEQGSMSGNSTRSGSFRRIIPPPQRAEEKWWLPVPCVPSDGLSDESRKHLRHQRNCTNQILKAAMAINSSILAEMEIPDTYMSSLPKVSENTLKQLKSVLFFWSIKKILTNLSYNQTNFLVDLMASVASSNNHICLLFYI